jgi:hypothetical protein
MTDFLLIHGAWHGAWCWQRVAGLLAEAGHGVVVPCLPGVGERAGELSTAVDLSCHAGYVADVIAAHRGGPLVAVAHSYAGAVLLAAGEHEAVRGRLAGRVFLDAVVLEDGEAVMDGVPPELARRRLAAARATGGLALAPPAAGALGLAAAEDVAHVEAHLTPHPLASYLEPIRLAGTPGAGPPACYLQCVAPPYPPVAKGAERAKSYGWPVLPLATGHDAMISGPQATAEALLAAAARLSALET